MKEERRSWYILWSPTDCSKKKVELVLYGMDAELWIPSFSQMEGQEKDAVPLYPGYYFVSCEEETVRSIEDRIVGLKAKGNLVFMKDENKKLYCLSEEEIKRIHEVEDTQVDEGTLFKNERVRIMEGPFKDFTGIVLDTKSGYSKISIEGFDREGIIKVKASWCERI